MHSPDWEQLTLSELADMALSPVKSSNPGCGDFVVEDGEYVILSSTLTPLPKQFEKRLAPLEEEEWTLLLADKAPEAHIRQRIQDGGLSPLFRKAAWKWLLRVQQLDKPLKTQIAKREAMTEEYRRLKREWMDKANDKDPIVLDLLLRVEKDVVRTDRNNPFYPKTQGDQSRMVVAAVIAENEKLTLLRSIVMTWSYHNIKTVGYVQGMCDIASAFLVVMNDELDGYRCFCKLMEVKQDNFKDDGSGMKRQLDLFRQLIKVLDKELFDKLLPANLFVSFRWYLVLFRREFSFEDIVKLWDQLLASVYSPDWIIFVGLGIFQMYRFELMRDDLCSNPDELIYFFQSKSQRINIDRLLIVTEDFYWRFERLARSRGFPLSREIPLVNILSQLDSSSS